MKSLVDVYPYRESQQGIEFLVLKRSFDMTYAGQWRMVAGKVESEEPYHRAALRELREETALEPALFWSLPSLNQFYEPKTDTIHQIPAFGARVDVDQRVTLNHEHTDFKWITGDEIEQNILWPEQQRLMKLLISIVMKNQILKEWIIEP